jgi:hypothetical protein
MPDRNLPPPWSSEEHSAYFVVRDNNGLAVAYVAKLLTRDEARRVALNIARLPNYCTRREVRSRHRAALSPGRWPNKCEIDRLTVVNVSASCCSIKRLEGNNFAAILFIGCSDRSCWKSHDTERLHSNHPLPVLLPRRPCNKSRTSQTAMMGISGTWLDPQKSDDLFIP